MSEVPKCSTYLEFNYLSRDSKSEENFVQHFKGCDEKDAQKIYVFILFEIEKSIKSGEIDGLKGLNWYIDFISSVKPKETLNIFYSDSINPFSKSNVIIFICKHNQTNVLEYVFSEECTLINNLSIKSKNNAILPSNEDDDCHNAFYYAINNNNCQLLETLVNKWPNNYFERNPEELDQLLGSTYKELKLKNIALSDEIQVCVEAILLNIRFYDNGYQVQNSNSIKLLKERIWFVLERIDSLKSSYTNSEEDENFILIAKFIVQNLFILKKQLKCTYNKLPWEEIEFCLTMFVTSRTQQHELNLFYSFVLTKNKILMHLENFANLLREEINNIGNIETKKLYILPHDEIKKDVIKRKDNIDFIIQNNPAFKKLYLDYQLVRDLYSLETIRNYVELVISVDPYNEEECLIIKRSIGIIGEHLKNTLESPKLSDSFCEIILSILPRNTLQIVTDLRNSFSHACCFTKWKSVRANADTDFYENIQNDVKKISSVILEILNANKTKVLKLLLESIINFEKLEELESLIKILKNVDLKEMPTHDFKFFVDEFSQIENLIEELNSKISNKTKCEENLLCKIKQIITSEKNKMEKRTSDYFVGYTYLLVTLKHFPLLKLNKNLMQGIKFKAIQILECMTSNIETESLKKNSQDVMELFEITIEENYLKNHTDIIIVIKKLFNLMRNQVGNVKWLEDLRLKLSSYKFAGMDTEITFIEEKNNINGALISELSSKLCTLKKIIQKNKFDSHFIENYSLYKSNHKLKVITETLILDILCILSDIKPTRLSYNSVFLDCDIPLLNGRPLRNHLTHNNALLDVFQLDYTIALLINARQFALENITEHHRKLGKVVKNDPFKLQIKYKRDLKVTNLKKALFDTIVTGNIEKLHLLIKQGADVRERNYNLWTTVHFAAMGGSVEIMKFLLNCNLSVNNKDINGQTPLHVASFFGQTNIITFLIKEMKMNVNDTDNMGKYPLHLAAQNGHENVANLLLKHHVNTKVRDAFLRSPLFYALLNGHKNVIQILWGKGSVDKNVQLGNFTSLHIAAEFGHSGIVDLLLKKGANVNAKTAQQTTPLHLSALNGHVDVVELLIRKGASVNINTVNGGTPLHNAVENGHEKIVEILLKNGANVNAIGECSYMPLHLAAKKGFLSIAKILVKNRAHINIASMGGFTPLHHAAANGHLDIVEFLFNKKVILHLKDLLGFTALHCSCLNGHADVVNYLIKKGAKINARDAEYRTPFHLAAVNGHIKVIELLFSKGVDLNCTDASGCSALHLSTAFDKEDVTEFLLSKGALVNLWNNFHISPLFSAIKNCNVKILKLLIARGADINLINSDGSKALHFSALNGNKETTEELIKQNADVNDKLLGETPLHLAVKKKAIDVVEVLIKNGAQIDAEDKSGFTPLCFAVKNNDKNTFEMLIENGADINANSSYPLFCAISRGFYDIVEILITNEKIKINRPMVNDITLLHLATELNHRVIVEALIIKGADINAVTSDTNKTPLHNAASVGATEVVKILLNNKAKINARAVNGFTPLHFAVFSGHASVVRLLNENGANVNIADYKNRTAIELAVGFGKLEILKMLLELKTVSIHDKATFGLSLVHIAAQCGHIDIMKHLIEKGADINSITDEGIKPIHFAAKFGHKDIVKFLLDLDPLGKHQTIAGQTPVHSAVLGGQSEVLHFLIDRKFDINASTKTEVLPIHVAVLKNNENILKVILHLGAFYNATYNGTTPLNIAQKNNYLQCVNLLVLVEKFFNAVKKNNISEVESCIKNGVPINVRNADNITTLHYACWKGYGIIVDILLENRADPNISGKGNCTPLHYAAKFNHFTVVKSLLLHGGIYNAMSSNYKTPVDFTSHDDIKNLLQLVDESFKKIKNGNTEIVSILKKDENNHILRSIFNAHDRENKTIIVAGINSDFPNLKQLKSIFQDGISVIIENVSVLLNQEYYREAISVIDIILEKKKFFGEGNLEILEIQQAQAKAFYKLHNYHKALELCESIYEKQKQLFGTSNSNSLETRAFIALIFHRLGKDEEAIAIFREILPKQTEILGSNDLKVLQIKSDMALALVEIGKYDEALSLNHEVYKAYKKKINSNHPTTLVSKNNIALVLLHQRKFHKSLKTFKEVYEARKKLLGPNHSDTLRTQFNMAAVQAEMDETDDHSESFKEILNLQKTRFGMQNRDTITTQMNTAHILFMQGKYHEAKEMYEECIENATAIWGQSHSTVTFIKRMLDFLNYMPDFTSSPKTDNMAGFPVEDMYKRFSNASLK